MGSLISVVSTYDATEVAGAIFNGAGVSVQDASWLRIAEDQSSPAGTFSNGPYGIGSGGILTNGLASSAQGDFFDTSPDNNNEFPGSEQYCGSQSFDATVLQVTIQVEDGYEGVEVEFILSSVEYTEGRPDPIGIYLDDVLWSIDDSNHRITATSKYLNEEIGINEEDKEDFPFFGDVNRATRYDGSSPPLLIGIPASPGQHTMIFAICDSTDGDYDSGLMVKAKGCNDCNSQVRINYVSTTTTTGSTSFTSTTKAVGTEPGTVLFGVPEQETTTTTEDTTTVNTDTTTTTEDTATMTTDTTTTTEDKVSSTATSDVSFADSTTLTLDQSSTATSTLDSTTRDSTQTSTATEIDGTVTSSQTTPMASAPIGISGESSTRETSIVTMGTTYSTSATELLTGTGSTSPEESTTLSYSSSTIDIEPKPASETTSTSQESSIAALAIATSTDGGIIQTFAVEDFQAIQLTKQSNSLTVSVPYSTSSALSPTNIISPTNLPVIGSFRFLGCLSSPDGYPSFDLVATSDDMTPIKCVSLATDRLYVGIHDRSCYASDSLESASLVREDQCDIPCASTPLLFCGGLVETGITNDALQRRRHYRRDAPSNVLLTLYGASDIGESSSGTLVTEEPAATSTSEIIRETTLITEDVSITSDAFPSLVTQPTASSLEFTITSGQAVPFPPNRPVPTSGWLGKNNMTQAVGPVVTVSTITYTIVDPQNPYTFKVEEYCSTIQYYPCHRCEHQDIPAVHMTTVQRQCNACGANGENSVYLTIPAAVAAPSATDRFNHPGNPPQHGSEPFMASPVETGLHHPKPVVPSHPTKAHYNPLPSVPKTGDSTDGPVRLNGNQPQVHPQDDFPKKPQVEAPNVPIVEPRPVDQVQPTSQFFGGYEIKTTTLPTWQVPSEVPVVVSAATMSFPILGIIFFVFAFSSLLISV